MSFRREHDPLFAWRKQNAPRLIGLGLPEDIVTDHHRFLLAVQNGEDYDSGWTAEWIAQKDIAALHALLSSEFDNIGWELVRFLERR